MKFIKPLLIVFSILTFVGCGEDPKQDVSFVVSGMISNAEGKYLYLSQKGTESIVPIDSVLLKKDGLFEFKSKTKELDFFVLYITPDIQINLILDSMDNVRVIADHRNLLSSYSISGSDICEKIQNLEQKLLYTKQVIDSLGRIYQANFKNPELDTIKKQLDLVFYHVVNEHKDFCRNVLEEDFGSLCNLVALSQYIAPYSPVFDLEKDFLYYVKTDSALMKKYANSPHVQRMNQFVKKLIEANEAQLPPPGKIGRGMQAPEIALPDKKRDTLRLSSFRGQYVLVNFWASWSSASRAENLRINRLYWKYFHKFEVFQVSLDQDIVLWKEAIKKDKIQWYHVCDLNVWKSKAAKDYAITAIPSSFMLDPQGKIIADNVVGEKLELKLVELFGK